jgi:SulP family sulfate permease
VAANPEAWRALLRLAPVGVGMGLLAAVLSLVAAAIAGGVTRQRGDGNRELVAQGVANLAGGLCGGIAVALSESRTLASWQAGGRGRLAGVAHALTLLAAGTLGAPLIVHVPQAVLAGLLLVIVVRAVDPWTVDLLRLALPGRAAGRLPGREVAGNVAIIVLVAGLTVVAGMLWALLAGVLVAVVQFIASMSGSPVRRILRGDALRSKKVRSDRAMDLLARHGREIAVCELQGSLFFGTADRLAREAERLLADGVQSLILDCKRVTSVDSSGVRMVQRLHDECQARGGRLYLAQLDGGHPGYAAFRGLGVLARLGEDAVHMDTDAALERAEAAILVPHRVEAAGDEISLDGLEICQDLSAEECAALAGYLERRRYEGGRVIFHEGDPGSELFLLTAGEVSVSTTLEGGRMLRLATFSAGVVFGEMALLDGAPRSASIIADADAVCLVLSVERYQELAREHPAIARRFTLNLARQLAARLRRATAQIRALER